MAIQVSPEAMSYEDFLKAYDGVHAEWVGGKALVMSPASERHQKISVFLTTLLNLLAVRRGLGAVYSAPLQMRLSPDTPGREPDLLFVANEHRDRLRAAHLEGPADLVIEIISPESRVRDRGEKFYEYEQGGVREYWLIDPLREEVELYRLDERGVYKPVLADPQRLESEVMPGMWIDPAWLWSDPLPDPWHILGEWGLV
ncbi:MAG: Uma2 family endonuclease [Gemmatimonadota bacterium]